MKLSERAIELPRLVILITLLVCGLGLAAVTTLPKERAPRITLPIIVVAVPNPGAGPDLNEKQIIDKIEEEALSAGETPLFQIDFIDERGKKKRRFLYQI